MVSADKVPDNLVMHRFSDSDITPCPACLASDPYGNVYVGVDLLGSLGKGPGAGRIIKLRDSDGDGVADKKTLFAEIDNPRGIIPFDDKIIVLHTEIPQDTKVLTGMHLSVLYDKNMDGKADGPPEYLVTNISVAESNRKRGADHTTNGIQLGIDGWVYIAVGDFGMVDAKARDGSSITMLGGGIVRVRPDGTELEVYTHGLRNIYDIAIDPRLNIYTRGNTNDGGGWNIRFIHNIQSAEYGYPILFKNFTDEIIPALADLGGGSGTGALFFQEPGWPQEYNNVPMMCDWGRSHLFIHRVSPDGPSFTQKEERFIECSQITDATCDASGRLYLGAWDRAGFRGNPEKGYVITVVPKDWNYKPFPHLSIATVAELDHQIRSESATARIYAQHEMIRRAQEKSSIIHHLRKLAQDRDASVDSRIAGIFTLKQIQGDSSHPFLARLTKDASIKEYAIRALTDRKSQLKNVNPNIIMRGLKDSNPRVQVASAVAAGRLGNPDLTRNLLNSAKLSTPDPLDFQIDESASQPTFQSKQVKRDQTINVKVDVQGWNQLYLGVGDSNDGDGNDHGAWFEPILVKSDGSKIPLTSLSWKYAKGGWGKTLVNKDCTGKPLKNGKGIPVKQGIGTHAPSIIVYDIPADVVSFQSKAGISSSAGGNGTVVFVVDSKKPELNQNLEGPHATPNASIVFPHVAVQSIVNLNASDHILASIGGPSERIGLWAMRYMHDPKIVSGLIDAFQDSTSSLSQRRIIATLIRLYHREQPYDGSWWWGTRPDTRGPYYRTETWEASPVIAAFVQSLWGQSDNSQQDFIASQLKKHRVQIDGVELESEKSKTEEPEKPSVDLSKIANKPGQVGKMAYEDLLIAVDSLKGNPVKGKEVFTKQGCVVCHTLNKNEALKGPFMGHIGGIMNREQIAEAIIKPNATISQGFATVSITAKGGAAYVGFIASETADSLEIRDITGNVTQLKTSDILKRQELEMSMMPPGLASGLSLEEFVSLVHFLSQQKQ